MFGWLPQSSQQPYPVRPTDRRGGHPLAVGSYRSALYSGSFFSPVSTSPETVTEDRWHQPVSQPYPYRKYLGNALWQNYFAPVSISPETVSPDRWFQPSSTPTRQGWRDDLYNSGISLPVFVPSAAESITVDKWMQPISQPYPYRRYPLPWQHPYFSPDPEATTLDRWFQPASQPRRLSWSDAVYNSGAAAPLFTPTPETVTLDKWFESYPQPYVSQFMRAALQQDLFWTPIPITPPPPPSGVTGMGDDVRQPQTISIIAGGIRNL